MVKKATLAAEEHARAAVGRNDPAPHRRRRAAEMRTLSRPLLIQ
jgi:hypothetical protein